MAHIARRNLPMKVANKPYLLLQSAPIPPHKGLEAKEIQTSSCGSSILHDIAQKHSSFTMEEPHSNDRLGLHVCARIHALSWVLRDLGIESFFNFL
jgi:hypothetical protein